MVEELLMNVVNAMSNCLDEEQLDKLQNVLYINFHDVRVVEEKNEIQATGTDSDTAKMRLFVASKKVSGRQDNTLAQYIREITNCRNALRKNIEDITTMDLRWYFGMLRERNKISMVTLQGRMRYLNSFWTFCKKRILLKIIQWRVSNRYVLRALSKRRFRHRSWRHFEWLASVRGIGRS
ncbi:hypothetical protein [Clostridium sp. AM48-13]|uniref:hypothetical protein n=1 Tax=Clostridium sp. AM48-13 TaxID=2293034 RepID=UPI001FA95EBF